MCFDMLNITESCQSELAEDSFRKRNQCVIAQYDYP
jgi:hypothetical protein